jgi:hypothetical protein
VSNEFELMLEYGIVRIAWKSWAAVLGDFAK